MYRIIRKRKAKPKNPQEGYLPSLDLSTNKSLDQNCSERPQSICFTYDEHLQGKVPRCEPGFR